jgi:hypothetical protein
MWSRVAKMKPNITVMKRNVSNIEKRSKRLLCKRFELPMRDREISSKLGETSLSKVRTPHEGSRDDLAIDRYVKEGRFELPTRDRESKKIA